jgi:hypothetical protein
MIGTPHAGQHPVATRRWTLPAQTRDTRAHRLVAAPAVPGRQHFQDMTPVSVGTAVSNRFVGGGEPPSKPTVALFNASADTQETVKRMLNAANFLCVIGCFRPELLTSEIALLRVLRDHNPQIVLFEISPPFRPGWSEFKTVLRGKRMEGRALVLTTDDAAALADAVGDDGHALAIVERPYDLEQITRGIVQALDRTRRAGSESLHPR